MNNRRLLLIDDEAAFRDYVRRVAEELDFDVIATDRGDVFRKAYQEAEPSLIMVDIVMPDEDGIEIIQWLAQQSCATRILVVSGYNPKYSEIAGKLAATKGMTVKTYVKPLRLHDLRSELTEAAAERSAG